MHQQTLTWLFMIQDIWSCISTKTPLKNIYNYRHKLELVLEKQSHLRVDQSVPADKEHRDPIGGGRPCLIPWAVIEPFAIAIHDSFDSNEAALTFENHGDSISLSLPSVRWICTCQITCKHFNSLFIHIKNADSIQ
jgi:hypothetical protein